MENIMNTAYILMAAFALIGLFVIFYIISVYNGLIRKRMERRVEAEFEKFPIIFSTLLAQNSKSMYSSETEKLFPHECF